MSADAYTLRTYQTRDAAQVWEMHFQGIQDTFGRHTESDRDADIRNIPEIYLGPGSHFWVVEGVDGRLAAMLAVKRIDSKTAEIKRVRVCRDLRRTGLAQRLIDVAEAFCCDQGYARIVLDTTTLQEPAQRLWEKNGFVRTGELRDGEFTLLLYRKDIG